MERQAQMSVVCAEDGTVIRASNEDELVRRYREHVQEAHDIILSDEEAREEIRESMEDFEEEMDFDELEEDEDIDYEDMDY